MVRIIFENFILFLSKHKGCGKCPLFTDPIEDDLRAMLDAGKRAKAKAAELVTNKARISTLSSSSSDSSGEHRFQPLVRAKKAGVEEVDEPEVNIERLLETAATPSQQARNQAHAAMHNNAVGYAALAALGLGHL